MHRHRWRALFVWAALIALLTVAGTTTAARYAVQVATRRRQVIAAGATAGSAGAVELHATLGQPFVGIRTSSGVALSHGFWHGAGTGPGPGGSDVYLPLVLREHGP